MHSFAVAIRGLIKAPLFTVIAVATIAIGIGANTALFSVFDQLVMRPVSLPEPSSLVAVLSRNALGNQVPNVSWPRYREIASHAQSFSSMGLTAFDTFTLTGNGEPEQLNVQRVDATFLPTLGVLPARGRNFTAAEDVPNGPAVCIISHELWQTRFGGRESILGEAITLNGQPWQVVGVMPARLTAPFSQVHLFAPRVFEVTGLTTAQVDVGSLYTQPIARLKDGVSIQQAQAELTAIGRAYGEQFGAKLDAKVANELQLFVAQLVGPIAPTFYALLGAVGFVLLIACANVASLFLGRLTVRQKEIAVRQSLGASRRQVIGQFMLESLAFNAVAGVLGVLLASWAIQGIQLLVASQLPPNTTLVMSWLALGYAVAATFVSAVLVGLAPAWHASSSQLTDVLRDAARGSTAGARRLRSALIVAEVALSVVLLVGASLLLLSFMRLQSTSPGFDPKGTAAAIVTLPASRYSTATQQSAFFTQVIEELRARPQVVSAAVAIGLPMSGFTPRSPYSVAGRPLLPLPQRPLAGLSIVSDDYFRMLGITFVEGRAFTADDHATAPKVCIINESLARRLFPGESALGKALLRGPNSGTANEIVGVIRDVRSLGINTPTPDEIYHPMAQLPRPTMAVAARTNGDAALLQTVIAEAVRRVDKDQPTTFFATLVANVAASMGTQRVVAILTLVFAGVALALAAIGLYSVLAYLVSQRTAEIGIRMALGAPRAQVVALVMSSGLRLVALGLVVGLIGAGVTAKLIQSLLFEVAPFQPAVYAGVAVIFTVVAALACLLPSLRASRIDPVAALQAN